MECYMGNFGQQPDSEQISIVELKEILSQLLPALEKLIPVAREFCEHHTSTSASLPCDSCTEKEGCSGTCDRLKKMLSSKNRGRGGHENLTGFYQETLEEIKRLRDQDVFDRYETCKHLLTNDQWIAAYLHYKRGLSRVQTAKHMVKGRSSVSELLQRAKSRIEEYNKKLREEKYLLLKKELSE
jgi:predicted DNA-binding protein YlxM (UPF0122 family)